jgi:cytochrome P450
MKSNYPPGPHVSPLGIPLHGMFRDDPLGFAVQLAKEYGDFVFARIAWVRLYLVNRPELIREILTTKVKSFRKLHRQMQALRKIEGEGLVVSDGPTWTRHRPMVQGSFHARHMRPYAQTVVELTERRLRRWRPNESFDLAADMNELAVEIIARVVFGVDMAEDAARIRDAVQVARTAMQHESVAPFPIPSWLPWPGRRAQRQALKVVDSIVWDLLRQRKASCESHDDMLGQMLAAAGRLDVKSPITDREIRDEAATLFVAGHDTTSATMSWLWYALAQHPQVQRKATQEVDRVLGERQATYEDLSRLKYLEMVVREAMRLYPASAFLFGRETIEDVTLGGYTLRKGSWVVISPFVVQRDARFFPDPETFDPERFSPERIDEIPPYAYIPFGGGSRICIGNAFAIMEMVLLMATVLQRYNVQLDQTPPELEVEIILRPRGGLRMRAIPREKLGHYRRAA